MIRITETDLTWENIVVSPRLVAVWKTREAKPRRHWVDCPSAVDDGGAVGARVCSSGPPLLVALPMFVFFLLRFRFLAMTYKS